MDEETSHLRLCLVSKSFSKSVAVAIISNLMIRVWTLNVDEKKLIVQFSWKSRDERFEPN